MKKLKVMTIVGTRPEIIRLSRVIAKLEKHCDHILVHTGQNYDYELSQVFFDDLGIRKPDYFLDSATNSNSAANTIGNLISSVDALLVQIEPDALLILGDTNSCLSVIPAKRRRVPIFHMEAGNRCFDLRVPEEINRKIVDHTADVNLTYSSIAREYLLREGLPPDLIIKTGSPMYEVINHYSADIEKSEILDKLELIPKNYFLVSAHREENIDSDVNFDKLVNILNTIAQSYDLRVLVSVHPRTRKKIELNNVNFHHKIELLRPFGFFDYVKLQTEARAVISDSGTINEEASILGFDALNLREAHERPEGMEEAAVMMTGLNVDRIIQCLGILREKINQNHKHTIAVSDYQKPNVADKVVKIIHSYTDYVQRVVWKNY
jgi:UDP-N-acetylglucosamine 2-epimerase (non-hydrolysing)